MLCTDKRMVKIFLVAMFFAFFLAVGSAPRAEEKKFEVLFEDKLDSTEGIAVCPDGGMYVAESKSGKVYRIVDDQTLEVYREGFVFPSGLACGKDNTLYVLEYKDGNVTALSKDAGGVKARKLASGLKTPNAAVVRSDGALFVSESDSGKVKKITADGKVEIITDGITYANGMAFNDDESILYVAATTPGKIYMVSLAKTSFGKKKPFVSNMKMADGLTRDGAGNLYVCLYSEGMIFRIDTKGGLEKVAEGLKSPATPVIKGGAIYATSLNGKGIYKAPLPKPAETKAKK